eukprot:6903985-Prymnesium_polylepis.1
MADSYDLLKMFLQQATTTEDVEGNSKVAMQDGLAANPFSMLALMNNVYKKPAADAAAGARESAGTRESAGEAPRGLRGGPNPFRSSSTISLPAAGGAHRNWREEARDESKDRRTPYSKPAVSRARGTGADVGPLDATSTAEKEALLRPDNAERLAIVPKAQKLWEDGRANSRPAVRAYRGWATTG